MQSPHVLLGPYLTNCILNKKYNKTDFHLNNVKLCASSFPLPFCISHHAAAVSVPLFVSYPVSSPVRAFHVCFVSQEAASPGTPNCQVCTTTNQQQSKWPLK